MKKLLMLSLLFVISISVNAQSSGPTKEQTIEYIIMEMNAITGVLYGTGNARVEDGDAIRFKYVEQSKNTYFKGCNLFFTLSSEDSNGPTIKSKKIDFSKVELIIQNEKNGVDRTVIRGGEIIKCKRIEKIDGKSQIIWDDLYVLDAEKMMKALNHLRKLCGAPEPISFD